MILASLYQIGGAIAMWACRQSPYGAPDNLVGVLKTFYEKVRPEFDSLGWKEFEDRRDLERDLEMWLMNSGFEAWNEPKIPSGAAFVFVSRYGGPPPDHDFIDLGALLRNVSMEIAAEDARQRVVDTGS